VLKFENFLEYQCNTAVTGQENGNFTNGLKATTERRQSLLHDINAARLSPVICRPPEVDSRLINVSGTTKESALHFK
jgi:hypothetical protein